YELDIYFFTASVVGVGVSFQELATQIIPRSLVAQLIGIIILYYPMTRLVQSTLDEKRG
ncbi:MAG TPA: rod shape-determining protein MreD, partial [Exiguobacterium sp.]|nr:rod shape-determining protein MreD [Exiguobacterium sp.]